MISLTCDIQNTTQRNRAMKQKQIHRHREQTRSCWGAGGRRDWKFGVQNSKNKPLLSLFLISHFSLRAKLLYLSPGLDFSNHNFALVCPYGALCFQRMLRLMAERGRRNGGTGSLYSPRDRHSGWCHQRWCGQTRIGVRGPWVGIVLSHWKSLPLSLCPTLLREITKSMINLKGNGDLSKG